MKLEKLNINHPIFRIILMIILLGLGLFLNSKREHTQTLREMQKEYRELINESKEDEAD